jgi:flagellar biosynthesis/type III secretory pathway chaperone
MIPAGDITHDLKQHLALCQDLLAVVEREGRSLRQPEKPALSDFIQLKKNLLPRLNQSLDTLRKHRVHWQKLSMDERARHPEIGILLRQNQDLIMKIILLDRENEQSLLRHGLVPARELPAAARQRPHFVADLYRRRGGP